MRVAVVGTGRMGAAMVGRLAGAGHDVVVQNRTRARADAVAERSGLRAVDLPREAAEGAEVVVVSLADDAAVRSAYAGPHGVVAGLAPGVVVADTSTVDPATVQALAPYVERAGGVLLDTPVSGSVSTVEAGELLVMAGGDAAALDRVRPVLDSFARQVLHLGSLGAGATMKLAVNSVVHALNEALAEALVLAEKAGVDRSAAYEVFVSSAVAAPFVLYKRAAYEHPGDAPVAFALDLVAKDLDLVADLAARVGADMPQLATNRRVVERARHAGLGASDLSALAEVLRGLP
jgi:3-hydroxyisobutyrate dehydrogenase-like beta-hydroxyacid dehydrogenase